MRQISSAYFAKLQLDGIKQCELIELTANTRQFYWTTANEPIVSSGQVYLPFPGKAGSGVEESTDLGVSNIDFTVANTGSIVGNLIGTNQFSMADILIYRIFPDTPDLGRMEIFRGKVGDYTYNRAAIAGQARSIFGGINQNWPYYTYQDNCGWKFGGNGCAFDTTSITVAGSLIVSSSTRQFLRATSGTISTSFSPGALEFGKVTITSGVNSGQLRTVFGNSGDMIIISHSLPFSHDTGGVTFNVFPGCRKRLVEDCTSRYNNNSAFLGWPWIPRQEEAF